MTGHSYKCDACSFDFLSGWSHHVGGQHCICRLCAQEYRIVSEKSPWGPSAGEQLPLQVPKKSGKRGAKLHWEDTGLRIAAMATAPASGFVRLTIDDTPCPKCRVGALTLSFGAGEECPKCHRGLMQERGGVIY